MNKTNDAAAGDDPHGLIWISGYSASGKTTVGRIVERRLKDQGLSTIFLDGDDLRSILGDRWGYDREARVDLAKVYFRLCSHLASQGMVVVISAVAMYDEVRNWVKGNIPRSVEIYLDVPEEERRRRDEATKNVYAKIGDMAAMYDEPTNPDLRLSNFGGATPEEMADRIIDNFLSLKGGTADVGRESHWRSYYTSNVAPIRPSPFAEHVADELDGENARLLEVGCGNGRDAGFFASIGHKVTAVDLSEAAIEFCREQHADKDARFEAGPLPEVAPRLEGQFDVVYSRFVLHAMPLEEEIATLHAASALLKPGGRLFVECRSINDPMARLGEVISPTERIHGHYRRFIIAEELVERVRDAGLEIDGEVIEADGLAVYKDDNPVVIRLSARKP